MVQISFWHIVTVFVRTVGLVAIAADLTIKEGLVDKDFVILG